MAKLLGVDIGTSATKVIVVDEQGNILGSAAEEHPISYPHPGWSEQNPEDWWTSTVGATRRACAQAKCDAVDAISFSGQMHGAVLLDGTTAEAKPLRPAILWNDQRTAEQCDTLTRCAGGRASLIEMTGNPALTGFTAPKLLWVRDKEPEIFSQIKQLLLPKDYVRFRMTGQFAMDVGDASGTSLLDVAQRQWHQDLVKHLNIDPDMLPPVVESVDQVGTLNESAAEQLGLKPGVAVIAGTGDQPAGAVGNGIVHSGAVSATLGTSGVVFAATDEPMFDKLGRIHTMASAVPGQWCVFGCMLSAGASFQWLRNELGEPEKTAAQSEGVDPYEKLIDTAMHAPAGCEGLIFLPYLTGERCPHPDPQARGGWLGLTARHGRSHMIRSVIEGITFGMADILRIMQRMGIAIEQVRLSGGGARASFWRQLQADVFNLPTAIVNASEDPAYGAAILAGVGVGVWPDVPQACDQLIRVTERKTPDAEVAKQYQAPYQQYRDLYPLLRESFASWPQ